METFEYYVEEGSVKRVAPNFERAKSLIKDGEKRINDLSIIDINKLPKIVFENIYDALRDFCDAILLSEGYKSYSHEGSISYLLKKGFDIAAVKQLDDFRYKRNGSKYYGMEISVEEAKDINLFCSKIKEKLYKILDKIKGKA